LNCVEAVASGTAIGQRASQLTSQELSCRDACLLAETNPKVSSLINDCALAIADLIANIKAITGTEIVVMGGSVGLAKGFKTRVLKALKTLPEIYQVELVSPALGSDADILGAALAIQNEMAQNHFINKKGLE
jgi:N-acylmannosamine kinase